MLKYILVGLTSLVIGTTSVANWQIQMPTVRQSVAPVADDWTLPKITQAQQFQKLYAKLRKLKPWSSDTKTTSAKATKKTTVEKKTALIKKETRPDWRFAGIVQQGHQRHILLLDKQNKAIRYQVNSSLPNGARLVRIHNDFIEVLQDGKLKTIPLFDK